MSFIREKEINGKDYLYLVESVREGDKVKQKVIKYLGPKGEVPESKLKSYQNS